MNMSDLITCSFWFLNFRFLGYFQPQVGKPALWEPESGDEHVLDDETW